MEGTCNGKFGFILCVMQSTDVSKGLIREGVGAAVFTVKYTCVAFLPHKGEVLDTIVTSVNKVRGRRASRSDEKTSLLAVWGMGCAPVAGSEHPCPGQARMGCGCCSTGLPPA